MQEICDGETDLFIMDFNGVDKLELADVMTFGS